MQWCNICSVSWRTFKPLLYRCCFNQFFHSLSFADSARFLSKNFITTSEVVQALQTPNNNITTTKADRRTWCLKSQSCSVWRRVIMSSARSTCQFLVRKKTWFSSRATGLPEEKEHNEHRDSYSFTLAREKHRNNTSLFCCDVHKLSLFFFISSSCVNIGVHLLTELPTYNRLHINK